LEGTADNAAVWRDTNVDHASPSNRISRIIEF
jgi:hypothetical protein